MRTSHYLQPILKFTDNKDILTLCLLYEYLQMHGFATELLLLVAHGSNDKDWSNAFLKMAKITQKSNEERKVELAFMERSSPSIEEAIKAIIRERKISRIKVLPLFLAIGKHLKQDIPEMLRKLSIKYDVEIDLLPPIGESPLLHQAVAEIAKKS